ncbi:MAG: DNA adenine methylase [Proteobacteria bacterium]|nr:MAG: DNA adenine methylase [Pseudomonadota bacterium]
MAKPFIKWVGGKTQLIPQLSQIILEICPEPVVNYVEPFIGGGALFFWLKSHNRIQNAVISDINTDLILTYNIIKYSVLDLIDTLSSLQIQYSSMEFEDRELMFYDIRNQYNDQQSIVDYNSYFCTKSITRAAQFIFLNKTCFNGLYRQNSSGKFNVPFGKYKKPVICDTHNLLNCSDLLQDVQIICGDFELTRKFITKDTLVYLDPPYKPISKTSSFTKYHGADFDDGDQIRLAHYYEEIDSYGAKIILSNSDPSSVDIENRFFDNLYHRFDILRVSVTRTVSAAASSRKAVTELIIKNVSLVF